MSKYDNWVILKYSPGLIGSEMRQYQYQTFDYWDSNYYRYRAMIYIINDVVERMRVLMEYQSLLVDDGYMKYELSTVRPAKEPAVSSM